MDLISLLPVIGFALFLQHRARLVPATALLHAVSGVVLVLYVGGLAGLLWPTAFALHVAGFALLGHKAWQSMRGVRPREIPVPYALFIGIAALAWLVQHHSMYRWFDDYAHWGVYIKEMASRDAYWPGTTNAMHPRYVPGSPLWHYFMTAFLPPSEGRTLVGHFVLLTTPLLVLWNSLRWRQGWWIIGVLALFALLVTDFGHGTSSLYVDHVLGAWFIGTLLCYMVDENRSIRHLCWYILPLSLLALLKDAGLAFALGAAAIMAALVFEHSIRVPGNPRKAAVSATLALLLVCLPVLACVQAWVWNRDAAGAAEDVQSVGGVASGTVALLRSGLDEQAAATAARFRDVFVHQQISNNIVSWNNQAYVYPIRGLFTDRFRLTTLGLLGFAAIWWFLGMRAMQDAPRRRGWSILGMGLLLVATAYLGLLFMSYLFAFGARGPILSSYVRYVQTIALAITAGCFALLLPGFRSPADEKRQGRVAAGIFAVALAGLYLAERPYWRPLLQPNPQISFRREFEPTVELIRGTVGNSGLWIFLPNDEPSGYFGRVLGFLFTPTPVFVERDINALNMPASLAKAVQLGYAWFPTPVQVQYGTGSMLLDGLQRVRTSGDGHVMFERVQPIK